MKHYDMHIVGLLLQNIFGVRFLESVKTNIWIKSCADRNFGTSRCLDLN